MTVLRQVAMNFVFLAILLAAGLMLLPAAFGYHRYVILTGSMTGTYDRGSVVFDKAVPTASLRVGDPITYAPPPGVSSHDLVTHRIFKITAAENGVRVFRTKGDFNRDPDGWKFMLPKTTQDRVAFHVPIVGFLFELLSLRQFRLVLIGVPVLLAALAISVGLWREAGEVADAVLDGLPDWGTIDHGPLPAPGALGWLPAVAPVFIPHVASPHSVRKGWSADTNGPLSQLFVSSSPVAADASLEPLA